MTKKISFNAQIEFSGNAEQFEQICEAISKLPVRVSPNQGGFGGSHAMPDDDVPDGIWTIPPSVLLEKQAMERLTKGMNKINISSKVTGGVQQPHLHIDDQIVMLNRSQFHEFVGLTAQKLAERLPEKLSYNQTVQKINEMSNFEG